MLASKRSSPTDEHLQIVVLAGGIGSRFWPASTPDRPKQLLPLASERPLIVDTVERAEAIVPPERVRILTGDALAAAFRTVLPELTDERFLIEPAARGTAPVLAWAAHRLLREDPDAIMVSLHADHRITPTEAFVDLVRVAGEIADRDGLLLTIGAPPDRPETGYGYIGPGEPVDAPDGHEAHRVATFTEKPDRETAQRYIADGYLWNTGIFVWRADRFLDEVRRCAPEIGDLLPLLDAGEDERFFTEVPSVAVDVAVLERSDSVATLAADFEWDDVGSWEALARTAEADDGANTRVGPGATVDASGNLIYAEDAPVVLWGVDDLVVVRTSRGTLVTPRSRAPDLKKLLDQLDDELRALETPE